jgi:hypothetical protein
MNSTASKQKHWVLKMADNAITTENRQVKNAAAAYMTRVNLPVLFWNGDCRHFVAKELQLRAGSV